MENLDAELERAVRAIYRDRPHAHRALFDHKNKTPAAGEDLIGHLHNSPFPFLLVEGFRGLGKSTDAEEALAIQAGFGEFKNGIIVGANADLAKERLHSIKALFRQDMFKEMFGDLEGAVWQDDEIHLSNGIRFKAIGRGASMLGIKFEDTRPDRFLIDDLEKPEEKLNREARRDAHRWLMQVFMPALDPDARGWILGTQRDPEDIIGLIKSGIEQAKAEGEDDLWGSCRYPITYLDAEGKRQPTWPERYPLERIDRMRANYRRQGAMREYRMEYDLVLEAESDRTFKSSMLTVEPRVKLFQPVYSMHDPARTVGAQSATTGFAAWSYIGPKIVVWDAWARLLMPSEIIDSLFDVGDAHSPVEMGFEEDGLNEWALQPIRQEQLKRRIMLPLRRMKAPRGKIDFIKGLQTYASARELVFARELPELKAQFLSFPTGRIDAPNALAYALIMKPGAAMYEDFRDGNIAEDLKLLRNHPITLALNAGNGLVTGALVQLVEGQLRIVADWVREGEPAEVVDSLIRTAGTWAGRAMRFTCPPRQFDTYNNDGLVQAAVRVPVEIRTGTEPAGGRAIIRDLIAHQSRGMPDFLVSSAAKWTLNGLAGGYCRDVGRNGLLADSAKHGPYRVLLEGIEAFAGLMSLGMAGVDDRNYRTAPDGTRYVSTMRGR